MDGRRHMYNISKPQIVKDEAKLERLPPPPPTQATGPRPLSDIRELSEPSVIDAVFPRPGNHWQYKKGVAHANLLRNKGSLKKASSVNSGKQPTRKPHARPYSAEGGSSSYSSTPEQSSFYSIPHSSVPRRSSSQNHAQKPTAKHPRKTSLRAAQLPTHSKLEGYTIPNRGQSRSPVKEVGLRLDAVRSDGGRRVPSKTLLRNPHPSEILEYPTYRHPRTKLELQVSAPIFVGGGSVEGQVKLAVDENERSKSRRSLGIGAISVDLVGFEDMPGSRKATFLALGTELIDVAHPPPPNMVEPANPLSPDEKFWTLTPSTSMLPFMISLPLDTGPPPFQSKHASIRFLLCATALLRDAGKHYRVRTSQDVYVLATYDPEKALTSLPSPLTATDELSLPRFGRCETVKITAGLHRQVWVSGSSIFTDVHIANKSHKVVKRLELSLERDLLCYKHAPAGTKEKSASQARIFESNDQSMITRTNLKPGFPGWNGVQPNASGTRTCELELPRGHATVRCGKYFEVRFFLNVTASLSNSKLVSVQLPIILIHINSLDVLPNSVAQVAAAIEEKRSQHDHQRARLKQHGPFHSRQRSASSPAAMADLRRRPSYGQGRAFAAPRQQSVDRQRAQKSDIDDLQQTLDSSPRKYQPRLRGAAIKKVGSNISIGQISVEGRGAGTAPNNPFADIAYHTPPLPQTRPKEGPATDVESTSNLVRQMQSLDSVKSKKSTATARSYRKPDQNTKPMYNFTVVRDRIEPHSLGLTPARRAPSFDKPSDPIPRPGTGFSFRDRMDRSRFEFKGVRRRPSESLKTRGMNLWEHVKHKDKDKDKEREGWI